MNISIDAGPAADPDVQALAKALREAEPEAKIMYRVTAHDADGVHNVLLDFFGRHGPDAAIYVAGAVTTKLVAVVADWAKMRWFNSKPGREVVVIYGPNEQPVKIIQRDKKKE